MYIIILTSPLPPTIENGLATALNTYNLPLSFMVRNLTQIF